MPFLIEDISNFQYYKYTGFTDSLGTFFKFVKRNEDNKIEKGFGVTYWVTFTRILWKQKWTSCYKIINMVNIKKYGKWTFVPIHRKLCVHSSHTTKSQAASATVLLNYPKIFPLRYTTKYRLGKNIYNDTKQCKIIYMLVYFKYLMLRNLRKTCRTRNDLEIASEGNYKLRFISSTTLIS